MGWRTAFISSQARLSARNSQLAITVDGEEASIPFQDLAAVILDNPQISLTKSALQEISKNYGVVIVCDEQHMPCGILSSYLQHHRSSEVIFLQTETSEAFKKRSWQRIVQAKITNQIACLRLLKRSELGNLGTLVDKITSGDKENVEAQAAKAYWPILFSENFKRSADTVVNGALNYGYSIIRSAVARAVVASGLLPAFGIHHCNKLNAFNLVDDLMEPFRPFVDMTVANLFTPDIKEFSLQQRQSLVAVINSEIKANGEAISLLKGCEVLASSYVEAVKSADPSQIILPRFLDECNRD